VSVLPFTVDLSNYTGVFHHQEVTMFRFITRRETRQARRERLQMSLRTWLAAADTAAHLVRA
jgi:hypothetical protein